MTQQELELKFSQANIHLLLRQAIIKEFDGVLCNWALGTYLRFIEYLSTQTYDSKNIRKQEMKDHVKRKGMDAIIADILVAILQHKKDPTLQAVVGYLAPRMPHEDEWDKIRSAGELLALGTRPNARGLYNIDRGPTQKPYVVVNYRDLMDHAFGELLEQIDEKMFNPPLLETPLVVTDNDSAGYHTVKVPVLLGNNTHHHYPLDYVTLNTLNKIQWVLDPDVLQEPEIPPSNLDTTDKVDQFTRQKNQAQKIYGLLKDRPFHMVWQYDSRGRIYSHGYHVNFQSYEYKKAMLSFGTEEHLV
jgi:hypothetical protein